MTQFFVGTVKWFDAKKGFGIINADDGPEVFARIGYGSTPEIVDGVIVLSMNYDGDFVAPREGTRLVFEIDKNKKGWFTPAWSYLERAAKVMRDDYIAKHDKCSCSHLFAEHEWATKRCHHCSCGENDDDLDHQTVATFEEDVCYRCGRPFSICDCVDDLDDYQPQQVWFTEGPCGHNGYE